MNKKIITGLVLLASGAGWGIFWRLESERHAYYDNFDPGYYLFLPGIIFFLVGLNERSAAPKGFFSGALRFTGNLLIFFGSIAFCGIGQSIAGLYYSDAPINFSFVLSYLKFIGILGLGLWIVLRGGK